MPDSRRCKVMVASDAILTMLFDGHDHHYRVVKDAVPADGRVVGVTADHFVVPLRVRFLVHSESFDEVPEGEPWPEFVPMMTRLYDDEAK